MNMTGKPDTPLLDVSDLAVEFRVPSRGGVFSEDSKDIKAVDGVSFSMARGETLGLVGESGCGKSTTGRAVLQLVRPTRGHVVFDEEPIHEFWKKKGQKWVWDHRLLDLRRRMQMIFQDPFASLNPRMTVETILSEPLRNFDVVQGTQRREKIQHLLMTVGMDPRCMRRYPHEFSGGQRQRIGIARALALGPDFIVADEPISALDVSIQAQIMNLLSELREKLGLTLLFIAHDLAAIRHVSDRIAVMYLGRIVELADAQTIVDRPQHPYTQALLSAVPIPDPTREQSRQRTVLSGEMPSPINPPSGCPFHTRCPFSEDRCRTEVPRMRTIDTGHQVACHLVE
ncbi:MAG: ATP-binding cassette domain-containing protein [Phycisphaeraceae bacterium]|nr:MAG: ATP-binding cassette domain-containing protein [Phycisphaeraceae bacterium]